MDGISSETVSLALRVREGAADVCGWQVEFAQAPFFFLRPAADCPVVVFMQTQRSSQQSGTRCAACRASCALAARQCLANADARFVSSPISKLFSAGVFTVVCGLVHGQMRRSQLEAQRLSVGRLRVKEQSNPCPKANVCICINSFLLKKNHFFL